MELLHGRPTSTEGRLDKEMRVYDLLDKLGIEYERTDHIAAMTMEDCMEIDRILDRRFGRDVLIALATTVDGVPHVRAVNSYYEDGCFYVITHAQSGKMRQMAENPRAAICGEWFTAHGIGENLGHVKEHPALYGKLREIFAAWIDGGHVDEADPDTVILQIRLTDGLLFSHGIRNEIDFT